MEIDPVLWLLRLGDAVDAANNVLCVTKGLQINDQFPARRVCADNEPVKITCFEFEID